MLANASSNDYRNSTSFSPSNILCYLKISRPAPAGLPIVLWDGELAGAQARSRSWETFGMTRAGSDPAQIRGEVITAQTAPLRPHPARGDRSAIVAGTDGCLMELALAFSGAQCVSAYKTSSTRLETPNLS